MLNSCQTLALISYESFGCDCYGELRIFLILDCVKNRLILLLYKRYDIHTEYIIIDIDCRMKTAAVWLCSEWSFATPAA